jgi:outer membrane cobalamin receptor
LYLGLAALLLASPSAAQVAGRVVDAETGLPVVGAAVQAGPSGAATDAEGRFRLDLAPGVYVLRVRALGYAPLADSLRLGADVQIALRPVALRADEVVVTAARRAQRAADVPVSIAVLRRDEIESTAPLTLADALRHVPGVQVAGGQVGVRGSSGFSYNTGSRVLFLLDGVPLLTPESDGAPLDLIPAAAVERIEVTRGPGSALYGGSALGGVVQVVTRRPSRPLELHASVQAGAHLPARHRQWREAWRGGDDARPYAEATLSASGMRGPTSWWLSAAAQVDSGYVERGRAERYRLFGRIAHRTGRTTLGLTLLARRSTSDAFLYWNSLADPLSVGRLEFGSVRARGASRNTTDAATLIPQMVYAGRRLTLTTNARVTVLGLRPLGEDDRPRTLLSGTTGIRYGASVQVLAQADRTLWTAGLSGDANAVRSSVFDSPSAFAAQPEAGAFVQAERTLGRAFVTAGLRGDLYVVDEGTTARQLSPSLSARLPLTDAVQVRASAGSGFRVPSIAERLVDDTSFLPLASNLDLRPETSRGLDVGVRAERGTLSAELTAFATRYDGLIEAVFVSSLRAFQFRNVASARALGTEAQLAYQSAPFEAQIAYQFVHTRDDQTGRPLPFRPAHLVQARFGATRGPWRGGVLARYHSAPANTQSDFARFVPDADQLGDARVADLYASWERGPLRVQLTARNTLNYAYAERPALLARSRSADVLLAVRL